MLVTSSTPELVVRSGHTPGPDGEWRPWFKIHTPRCRYADGADSLGIFLDLWGAEHLAIMIEQERVALCKICKPVLP